MLLRFIWASAAMLSVVAPSGAKAADALDIYGQWVTPDRDAIIAIENCGALLCADLVAHAYEEVAQTDRNNPDPTLQSRPLLGVRILHGLKMVGMTKWSNGTLYDPRTGKTYSSKVKILDSDRLKITGCIGPGLCKGYVWERAKDKLASIPREAISQMSPLAASRNN